MSASNLSSLWTAEVYINYATGGVRVISMPIYVMFMLILWRHRYEPAFNNSFFTMLFSAGLADMLNIVVCMFQQSPLCHLTAVRTFLISNALISNPLMWYIDYVSVICSALHITCLAVNRYHGSLRPLEYKQVGRDQLAVARNLRQNGETEADSRQG
jgi:hypothetical protein